MDEFVVDTGCGLTATGYKKITPGWLDVVVVLVEETGAVEIGGNDAVEVGADVVSLTGVTVTVVVTTCVGVVGVVACRKESLWRFFVKGTCKRGNYCAVYHG